MQNHLKKEAAENQILLRVPFAQHGFDIFPSITAQCVVPFVERYLVHSIKNSSRKETMNTEIQTQSETVSESEALVLREDNEGLVTLTLNRPRQFNALSEEVLAALQVELDRIAEDQQARLVVIAGNGKAFCAGHDLKQMSAKREEDYYRTLFKQCSKMMLTLNQMPQPVIAKVQGIATAAGCQLVAACDLAVVADDSRFATSGINVGLFCSTPSVPVSRNLGRKQAMELLLTGHFIDAHLSLIHI